MFDIDGFLDRCADAASSGNPTIAVREVVAAALRDGIGAAFEPPGRASLEVLRGAEPCVVLHAVWAPGMHFPPHDHRTWAVVGICGGDEDNAFYRRSEGGIVRAGGRTVGEGEIVILGADVIHAVTNPRTHSFTGAIHVYGGPYLTAPRSQWSEPELVEGRASFEASQRIFEEANGRLDAAAS